MVVGGGIAGITATVELAEAGREVVLIEKEAFLGGNVVKMNNYFPKFCPPACGLEINFRRIRSNRRIRVITGTTVESVYGEPGNIKVKLRQAPKYINDYCTACGKCSEVCPVEREDSFNYGFDKTKAAYLPYEMAYPMAYVIDGTTCRGESCAECVNVCNYNAINLSAREETLELIVERVLVATGWHAYDASGIKNLGYDAANVVTNVELERLLALNGPGGLELVRPSDRKKPSSIAFVQCAGSRDENHLPYCSAVCCSASLKHALTISDRYPDVPVKIFYIDLRVSGRNEDVLNKARERKNITLVKGKVGLVSESGENQDLEVVAEDIHSGKRIKEVFSMVVLATGMVPNKDLFKLERDRHGFAIDQGSREIIATATSKRPMDVSTSVKDATSAAVKALKRI